MTYWPNYKQVLRLIFDSLRNAIRVTLSENFVDPTERIRTSTPYTLFSNKNLHSRNETVMKEDTNGAGASITHVVDESSVNLTVGTVSGEYAIRQSRHIPYVPGKGIRVQLTGIFAVPKANVEQRLGYYDELDGFHFLYDTTGIACVLRTSTSGSVSDAATYYQANWNIDTLDGSGDDNNPSGIQLDLTKVELFYIDGLWQGVGRVRYGFDIGGEIIYVHSIDTANEQNKVYTMRPSLPLRYEIRNTGTSASSTTLKEICCQVDSEGGFQVPGIEFAAPSTAVTYTGVSTTPVPIIAVRLKNTIDSGKLNRATARLLGSRARVTGSGDVYFTMHHIHDPTFTVTGAWTSTGAGSFTEYHTTITSISSTVDHIIDAGPIIGGTGSQSGSGAAAEGVFNEHGLITQNIAGNQSQAFVVYAQTYGGNADVSVSIKWTEFD